MNAIAEKIHLIEQLSSNPTATNLLLDKVIEYLVDNDRRKLEGFREKLAAFERQHGMSTAQFQQSLRLRRTGRCPRLVRLGWLRGIGSQPGKQARGRRSAAWMMSCPYGRTRSPRT